MMQDFYKYQGTGNDFICLEDRGGRLDLSQEQIRGWCQRRFGVGADGLMVLAPHPELDFSMKYYNADGLPGSMCGNGARCLVQMARDLNWIAGDCRFMAPDGVHEGRFLSDKRISISMQDVTKVQDLAWEQLVTASKNNKLRHEIRGPIKFMDTGSPHLILLGARDVPEFEEEARQIRNGARFSAGGTNVNWVYRHAGVNYLRTFERGVEAETLSCGTGTVAAALYLSILDDLQGDQTVALESRGGPLTVNFHSSGKEFTQVQLIGPAERVFQGRF